MEFRVEKPGHIFVVKSSIREFINENDMRISAPAIKKLNESIEKLLLKAIERANGNKRKTVLPQDVV